MKWTEDQLVIKDGKEYILSPKGNLVPRRSWENLPEPFTGKDDPRVIAAQTPEVKSQRGRTCRAKRTFKESMRKQLQLLNDTDKEYKDLDAMEFLDDLNKYNKTSQDALISVMIEEGKKGNMKAVELIIKTIGGFAPEETNININGEAQSTMALLNAKLKDRAQDLYDEDDDEEDN